MIFGEDLNMDWTFFVAVNAGVIGRIGERYMGETRSVDFSTMIQRLGMIDSRIEQSGRMVHIFFSHLRASCFAYC